MRAKLIAAFGFVLPMTGCLGAFAVKRMGTMHAATEIVSANYYPASFKHCGGARG